MARRTTRVGITDIARILGLTETRARKQLDKLDYVYPKGADGLYDARVIDIIRALRGQPHRALQPPIEDWLAHYVKELHDPEPERGPVSGGAGRPVHEH